MLGARKRNGTSGCSSATSASTRLAMPSSVCVDIFSVGHAYTSGWRRGPVGRFVRCARQLSAGRRSFHYTAEATLNKRTQEIRCPRGRPGSARSPRARAASRASASERASTCPSASAPSPSASSPPPSTSATPGLVRHPAARPSTRKSSSYPRYSCGWPSSSCCGSSSRDPRCDNPPCLAEHAPCLAEHALCLAEHVVPRNTQALLYSAGHIPKY